ncbi:hypothetical protein RE428_11000 [Marinobacter nanhaiticus D15-8W]|uniref:glucan endo-1,3-beta-D-glucosidase n=1 Tax=Marinobacter nanhaiticus D15-8W TaxID=626887 RepID=N6WNY6_9GAMM|nr:glycosyl hydrolase [Marinobacter nanhaiticus]ENO12737.1 glucan 1,3-beta-glucanase [Marinobacter nanhaiticus D15-8W]BES70082.1 hypothetical protein RE428_11000 [Marinobacter nanhaiticus D15-8W]
MEDIQWGARSRAFVRSILASTLFLTFTPASTLAAIQTIGAGSIADRPNPDGYTCVNDYGAWIHNAGVVEPGIAGCDPVQGPIGEPTPLYPHVTGPADAQPTGTHRWWGSVAFYGDMPIGDANRAGYITPDPIAARITDRGFRMASIPDGMQFKNGNTDTYDVPAPFDEVFDGLAIGNSQFSTLDAKMYDYSDGSVTVEWQNNGSPVMRGTFVHGSPYVYVDVLQGELELRSKAPNGPEKGVFHQSANQLGMWTDVAGNHGNFLVVGNGSTQFHNVGSDAVRVSNPAGQITVALIPTANGAVPDAAKINRFAARALNRVNEVRIDYQVDEQTQDVTVTQRYLFNGQPVDTFTGLMPLQWKNTVDDISSQDQIRSARGYLKFGNLSQFRYRLPFVGVLPTLPALNRSYDNDKLTQLIREFVAQGPSAWNSYSDTYWSGKSYGKVAEVAALAYEHGLTNEHEILVEWLKLELEDWFTAQTNGQADVTRYFSYDDQWNTLLGYDESFGAQQELNDHHFHYGYFVRAAAEICRTDKSWCAANAWGGMVEMLIRDYAGQRDDPLFPYVRNFDPANGFSWASGHANFVLGNNNESTSEAANAYGAIVLYGEITGNDDLVDHGIYLHTLSTASYWEYWNNIDRYRGFGAPYDNFAPEYDKMTTSIIWGSGHVFSTWFSGAYAHILGIQGLPLNPMVMHIGQHADYLSDYVDLGLSESSNGKPSGLANDQWRDVWWNIWAMTEPEAAIADFNTMDFNYDVEAGESKPHTYHWIHTLNVLGHIESGKGEITADSPIAQVYEKNGQRTYVAYNYHDTPQTVTFSDGTRLDVPADSFGISGYGTPDDSGGNGGDNGGDDGGNDGGDSGGDSGNNGGDDGSGNGGSCSDFCFSEGADSLTVTAHVGTAVDLHYRVNDGPQQNVRMTRNGSKHVYTIPNLGQGDQVDYFFTVIEPSAYDTEWSSHTFGNGGGNGGNGGSDGGGNNGGGDSGSDTGGGNGDAGDSGALTISRATASTATQSPSLAVDGDAGTRWESDWLNDGQWLTLDLPQTTAIRQVEIDWEAANAANYDIWLSENGSDWWHASSVSGRTFGSRTDVVSLNQSARYVSLVMGNRSAGNDWGYSIYEVRLIGQ